MAQVLYFFSVFFIFFEIAKKIRLNAQAELTHYKVGCALVSTSGQLYCGVNVESCVCSLSLCAEAVAIFSMVTAGEKKIRELMVVTQSDPPGPPCGSCRQRLVEFADLSILIHYGNIQGKIFTKTLGELLPETYTPAHIHL